MSDDSGSSAIVWILAGLGGLAFLLVCSGIVAAIAIPAFMKYLKKSKTAEAEQILKTTSMSVERYYQEHSELPGAGERLATSDSVPQSGEKYVVRKPSGPTSKKLWESLSFPSADQPIYFQYVYEANANGKEATVKALHDFEPGGRIHTVSQTIEVNNGELQMRPVVTLNEFR